MHIFMLKKRVRYHQVIQGAKVEQSDTVFILHIGCEWTYALWCSQVYLTP